jgi:hypothetical protein
MQSNEVQGATVVSAWKQYWEAKDYGAVCAHTFLQVMFVDFEFDQCAILGHKLTI